MKAKNSSMLTRLFYALFAAFFVVFLYTFLHEGGHALIGILFGGKLTGFNINFFNLSAHVELSGKFSTIQESVKSVAGALLPLVVWVVFILSVPKKTGFLMEFMKLISSGGIAGSLLPWVVIPILYKFGAAPAGDDVTWFISYSKLNVYLVAAIFLALICFVAGMFLMKSDLKSLKDRDFSVESERIQNKKVFVVMSVIIALSLTTVIRINNNAESVSIAPRGYRLASSIKLSARDYSAEPAYSFTLDKAGDVGLYIVIRNINTKFIDIRLQGEENYDYPLLHGEGYWTNYDKCDVKLSLKKGRYQIMLTSKKSPGRVFYYVKIK